MFSPRSLDVDVVLDLMIHDVDIVLALVGAGPAGDPGGGDFHSVRESGHRQRAPAVSQRMRGQPDRQPGFDRAGRKLRLFQPHQYLSLDYGRQDLAVFSVGEGRQIGFEQARVTKASL